MFYKKRGEVRLGTTSFCISVVLPLLKQQSMQPVSCPKEARIGYDWVTRERERARRRRRRGGKPKWANHFGRSHFHSCGCKNVLLLRCRSTTDRPTKARMTASWSCGILSVVHKSWRTCSALQFFLSDQTSSTYSIRTWWSFSFSNALFLLSFS